MPLSSVRQELFDHWSDAFGMGEVDVVTALDLRRLEVSDHRQPRHHDILREGPPLESAHC